MQMILKTKYGELIQGDNLKVMNTFEDEYFDNCISDFPYNLAFMGKKWDNQKNFYDWCYQRAEKLYPKIKKGGYVMIFGHHKTNHRMKCAFEDAGFKIVEEIDYVYGCGFPKNQDIGKLFDKKEGKFKKRQVIGKNNSKGIKSDKNHMVGDDYKCDEYDITAPISNLAKQWNGWKTSGLKPAKEIITVFQKPLEKNYCNNVKKYNCGAMNIDTCRIPYKDKKDNIVPTCLNAKNYGIPQNRDRIFIICIRKNIDNNDFKFWEGKDYGIRLKDILEDSVDEKYYLSQEIQDRFKLNGTKDNEHNELNVIGSSAPKFRSIGQRDMTYGVNGIMSTLTATDYKQPKQIVDNKLLQLNSDFFIDKKGREQKFKETKNYIQWDTSGKGYKSQEDRTFYEEGSVGTIPAMNPQNKTQIIENMNSVNFRIRKLTPLECWRLMGFRDRDFYKAKEMGILDSQLYKQAGNSIVVNCLYFIFKELFKKYIVL